MGERKIGTLQSAFKDHIYKAPAAELHGKGHQAGFKRSLRIAFHLSTSFEEGYTHVNKY